MITTPQWQPGGETRLAEDGSHVASERYIIHSDYLDASLPTRNVTAHPTRPTFKCSSYTASNQAGGLAEVTVEYKGPSKTTGDDIEGGGSGGTTHSGELYSATTVINSTQVQVDIQNKPSFAGLAGTWDNPINDSRWDGEHMFIGFGPGAPLGLRGVRTYPVTETTIQKRWTTTYEIPYASRPCDKIVSWRGRQGVRLAFSSEQDGAVFRNTETILLTTYVSPYLYSE